MEATPQSNERKNSMNEKTTGYKKTTHAKATETAKTWAQTVFEMTNDFPTAKREEELHHDKFCGEC